MLTKSIGDDERRSGATYIGGVPSGCGGGRPYARSEDEDVSQERCIEEESFDPEALDGQRCRRPAAARNATHEGY